MHLTVKLPPSADASSSSLHFTTLAARPASAVLTELCSLVNARLTLLAQLRACGSLLLARVADDGARATLAGVCVRVDAGVAALGATAEAPASLAALQALSRELRGAAARAFETALCEGRPAWLDEDAAASSLLEEGTMAVWEGAAQGVAGEVPAVEAPTAAPGAAPTTGDSAAIDARVLGTGAMDASSTELWWAGRPFERDAPLGARAGFNDKTRIIVTLQRAGSGAPPREAAVSDAERSAMLAWCFKKQEEDKALAEDHDDRFLSSPWADPKALRTSLNGVASVSWRPGA